MTTRRRFLSGIVGLAALGCAGSYFYLKDEDMQAASVIDGRVLCDLHAHPSNRKPLEEIVAMLASPGLVGLTRRPKESDALSYEEAVSMVGWMDGFKEITRGQLARFRDGYFARTEEIDAGGPDIIAIGFDGDYLPNFDNPFRAIKAVHERNGVAVFSAPYTVAEGKGFRLATQGEETIITQICPEADLVEVHNAYNINFLWFGMRESNKRAQALVRNNCYDPSRQKMPIPFASSDAHRELDQVKITGVYVKEEALQSMNSLKDALRNGDFTLHVDPDKGPYISRASFVKGIVLPQVIRMLNF